jgi:hypothetical protein
MKIKQCLDDIVMFDFSFRSLTLLKSLWKSVVTSEHDVAHSDLVITCLRENLFTVVEHIHFEVFGLHSFNMGKFFSSFK